MRLSSEDASRGPDTMSAMTPSSMTSVWPVSMRSGITRSAPERNVRLAIPSVVRSRHHFELASHERQRILRRDAQHVAIDVGEQTNQAGLIRREQDDDSRGLIRRET